jgi:hypothetical protein
MKKRYLQTNFIKFLIEKYEKEIQELPEEETNLSDNKLSDEFDRIINGEDEQEEIQDEVQEEPEENDENIDEFSQVPEFNLVNS